jgi:hypothetical protein
VTEAIWRFGRIGSIFALIIWGLIITSIISFWQTVFKDLKYIIMPLFSIQILLNERTPYLFAHICRDLIPIFFVFVCIRWALSNAENSKVRKSVKTLKVH